MSDEQDVNPSDSSPEAVETPTDPTATPGVTEGEDQVVGDRPLKNIQAEFNRKIGRLEDQMGQLIAALQAPRTTAPAQVPASTWEQASDDQLMELYRAGSAEAGRELIKRETAKAAQEQNHQRQQATRHQVIAGQLQYFAQKYPFLRDNSHPVTQAFMQARQALIAAGYPDDPGTTVEAVKTALLDYHSNPQNPPMANAPSRGQHGIDGATMRRTPRSPNAPAVNEREAGIAKRMGIKDPAKAKERFLKNQADGRSSVSPTIAVLLKEES